ncbi:MAG TPA: Rne/Rng family ribonuclease, partial [Telluria sp.]|nr:Rne/Rng family ribonuclease [Telluria sp.]
VEGEERQELRETMDKLDLPQGMSVIARTAGIGRNVEELQWDLNYLMQLWRAIEGAGTQGKGAFLIYQESSLVIRAIRDYFQPDIGEILIDTDDIYEQAHQFMSHVMPDMVHRVKRYSDDVPLFSRFQIEHQIETAYSRTVPLPSGGAIVIDHTEALVSVDVNSARATRGSDIETTAFNTNCEAAEEVARQLRLRDLGGLIVIDFIDMEVAKNQREVETRLKDALHHDRARVQMGKISRFGLMELSRQRLRPSLSEGSHVTCPRCSGTGHIRDTESSALQVLRIIQEEAMKENSATIHVQVPVDVAAFLLNEKRGEVLKIENRHRIGVILIPNKHLDTPH